MRNPTPPRPTAIVVAALAILACDQSASPANVTNPRCENRVNPPGLDVTKPRLSWTLGSDQRGQKQTAYHILVASSAETLAQDKGDLWDRGQVSSDQTLHVTYAGAPVSSRKRAWWKVRIWDSNGKRSDWSQPAFWSMGLLAPSDWSAKWVGRGQAQAKTSRVNLLISDFTAISALLGRSFFCNLNF